MTFQSLQVYQLMIILHFIVRCVNYLVNNSYVVQLLSFSVWTVDTCKFIRSKRKLFVKTDYKSENVKFDEKKNLICWFITHKLRGNT